MTGLEMQEFYVKDRKLYNVENNKELLKWIKNRVKKGYNIYIDTNQMQELIDYIALWYEMKYPERELQKDEGIIYPDFENIDNISDKLDINQLLYRLPDDQECLLSCPYRASGWGTLDVIKDGKTKCETIAFMNVDRNVQSKYTYPRELNHFLVRVFNKTGIVYKDFEIEKYFKEDRDIKIEELVELFEKKYNDTLNYGELKKCLFDHETDLELRKKIMDLVPLKLLYSKNTIPIRGYIRARKFIYDFNEYFDLGLTEDNIEFIINKYYDKNGPEKYKVFYLK